MIDLDQIASSSELLTNGASLQDILRRTYLRIEDSDCWTQGSFARTWTGESVRPSHPSACRWCLLGAIALESNPYAMSPPNLLTHLEERMQREYGEQFDTLGAMNDYLTHENVLAFLQRAIAEMG